MRDERIAPEPKRRSWSSKLLEFLFWIAIAVITAYVLIQNVDSILPANNF